ncbi:oxidoreductase [Mucilaginibacter hurinus]|uniref:Oxidoreductase n=1 Tax=Mucilaginibacter hurinus TaxID=2201324 RepID=A0A367GL81_9SPHI|nr:Gfo/Idh/MocA family oxidoreductase [Mucilaginibacter hurinus]RCH54234.1 oxidoreductase [Mucilaginibacter hurinus]
MSSPIVAGLMAFGMSGRVFHAPFLSTSPDFKLKAVVERNQKKAHEIYPDIVSYTSIDELLQDDEIELVVVNTPSYTHYDYTKQALNAGKHVLLEKPAAATSAEAKELFDLAAKLGLKLMVYQNRRWDSGFLSVKEVVESGRLGDLIEVHLRFDRYKPAIGPKLFKETAGFAANGVAYDLGPHLIDNAIALFGRPLSFHKTEGKYRENSQVTDYFHLHMVYPKGLNVYLTSGLLIAEALPAFVIHGKLGSFIKNRTDVQEDQLIGGMMPTNAAYGLEPEHSEGKLVTFDAEGQKVVEWLPSKKGDYSDLFKAVYHTIKDGALFPVSEEHIAWQLEMLEN